MKRRRLLQSVAVLPAAAALPVPSAAQQYSSPSAPQPDKLGVQAAGFGEVARAVPRFFTEDQFQALQRLADILMPSVGERPGAKQAGAAEFLDFLISQSDAESQQLYRSGLDRLNADAKRSADKNFASLTDQQAAPLLKPLTTPWTYNGPADPFANFLLAAKEDVMRATYNSREFTSAMSQTSRGFSGTSHYWYPAE